MPATSLHPVEAICSHTDVTRLFWVGLEYGIKLVGLVLVVQVLKGVWWLVDLLFIAPPFDPLRHLPGPDAPRFSNHFEELMDPEKSPAAHEEWVARYGKTFRAHGFGAYDYRLVTFDLRALQYILNSPTFEKPWQTRLLLSRLLGQGVSSMEGQKHRIQRRILAPAFTPQVLKNMAPIMLQKAVFAPYSRDPMLTYVTLQAEELRDEWSYLMAEGIGSKWDSILSKDQHLVCQDKVRATASKERSIEEGEIIDVAHWSSRATLDVIGLAGFDYAFRALETETEEVYVAYRIMFHSMDVFDGFKRLAEISFPIIRTLFPDKGTRQVDASLATIKRKGEEIVKSKREAIMAEIATSKDIMDKDILSLLIKANLSENPSMRLSDSELLDQISTFLFAGSDTTSVAIAWALHHISFEPEMQSRLRDELASCHVDANAMASYIDELDNLPFLDAVVHESLRLAPPVHGTIRVAMRDEMIPLSEPILLRTNEVVKEVFIRKGSYVHIPIEGLNYTKDMWGEDALEFKPDRWFSLPASASSNPGLANVMSFTFGPHACIGWRFAILEMKVFLATLIPHFVFSPVAEIGKYNTIVTRPYVRGKLQHGTGLPLKVSRYSA